MLFFNERHLGRVLFLSVDQCGSSSVPFVSMVQSADRRYGDDISSLSPAYESDTDTARKSLLLRANLDEGTRCLRPARTHREAPPHARVTTRRSVHQFQRERRAVPQWLVRHPVGRSIESPQTDHVGHAEAALERCG